MSEREPSHAGGPGSVVSKKSSRPPSTSGMLNAKNLEQHTSDSVGGESLLNLLSRHSVGLGSHKQSEGQGSKKQSTDPLPETKIDERRASQRGTSSKAEGSVRPISEQRFNERDHTKGRTAAGSNAGSHRSYRPRETPDPEPSYADNPYDAPLAEDVRSSSGRCQAPSYKTATAKGDPLPTLNEEPGDHQLTTSTPQSICEDRRRKNPRHTAAADAWEEEQRIRTFDQERPYGGAIPNAYFMEIPVHNRSRSDRQEAPPVFQESSQSRQTAETAIKRANRKRHERAMRRER